MQMADPQVTADYNKLNDLAQERSDIKPLVDAYRLYEQKQTAPEGAAALDNYLTRWRRCTTAGLNELYLGTALSASHPQTGQSQTE